MVDVTGQHLICIEFHREGSQSEGNNFNGMTKSVLSFGFDTVEIYSM